LAHTIAHRDGRFLERQGLLERLHRFIARPVVSQANVRNEVFTRRLKQDSAA